MSLVEQQPGARALGFYLVWRGPGLSWSPIYPHPSIQGVGSPEPPCPASGLADLPCIPEYTPYSLPAPCTSHPWTLMEHLASTVMDVSGSVCRVCQARNGVLKTANPLPAPPPSESKSAPTGQPSTLVLFGFRCCGHHTHFLLARMAS